MRRTGGQYLPALEDGVGKAVAGKAAASRAYECSQAPVTEDAVCGAWTSGLSSAGHSPAATWSISALIAIMASQNRSSSPRCSLSVGSTISVPGTGNDMVGAWKP